jgi:hypothetical protein
LIQVTSGGEVTAFAASIGRKIDVKREKLDIMTTKDFFMSKR